MSSIKHNWAKLKAAFLKGKYKSLKEFADYKKIPYRTVVVKGSSWLKVAKKIAIEGEEKTVEKLSDKVAEMNVKHMKLAQDVIDRGSDRLPSLDFESAAGAVQAIKTGIEIQREIILPKGKDNEVKLIIEGGFNTQRFVIKKGEEKKGEQDAKSEK